MKYLFLAYLSLVALSCQQTPGIPDDFDFGKIDDGKYTNGFFNMEVTLPDNWFLQNREQVNNLLARGQKFIDSSNKKYSAKYKAGMVSTAPLVVLFKNDPDSMHGQFNPAFMIMAENLGHISGVKTGADYLDHVKRNMQQTGINYQFSEYTSRTIGGKSFDVLKAINNIGEVMDIRSVYHVILLHGFALVIINIWATEEEEAEMADILHGLKFS